MQKLLIALGLLMSAINAATTEELLELGCVDAQQCKQFQHTAGNVSCIEGHCRCIGESGEQINCKPKDTKLNNIIGGPCPCPQPRAECILPENVCYCAKEHLPSHDRRRCIRAAVQLAENCEMDTQCQALHNFAVCHSAKRLCRCKAGYIEMDGKCAPVLAFKTRIPGKNVSCVNDADCAVFGTAAACATKEKKCICKDGFVKANNGSDCMASASYQKSCNEHTQCQLSLGVGALCESGVCQCAEKYFAREVQSQEDGSMKTICAKVVEFGAYCRSDADCYQHQLPETAQLLECSYSECNCKIGYYSINNADCIQSSGSSPIRANVLFKFILILGCSFFF